MTSKALINEQKKQLLKALSHLEYSFKKISGNNGSIDLSDDENLETWESFSARFSRVVDLFLARFIRLIALYHDPGFRGTLRDHLNAVIKLNLIDDDPSWWLKMRELRNIAAHEYNDEDIKAFYQRILQECPKLLSLKSKLESFKT